MSNLTTMLASVKEDILEPADTTAITRHICTALRHFRGMRFAFSEKTDTFPTVANQEAYTPGSGSVPVAIYEIDHLAITINGYDREVRMVTWPELLRARTASSTAGKPKIAALYGGLLYLHPKPDAVHTITMRYIKDATRDAATGNEITTASAGTVTNEFFTVGEELLRTRTIYSWAMTRGASSSMATSAKLLYNEALSRLRHQYGVVAANGRQAPAYL